MKYLNSACVMFALLFTACTGAADGDWISTDHDDVTVRTKRTDAGLVSELRSIATDELVESMVVTGATASYQDRNGIVHELSLDAPLAQLDDNNLPRFTAVQAFPTDELTANEWLYTLSLDGAKTDHQNNKPYCFAEGNCGWCCQGDICCWSCPDGFHGCARIIQ